MPMGWHGARDAFSKRMDKALADIPDVYRVVKDILIATDKWEAHVARV